MVNGGVDNGGAGGSGRPECLVVLLSTLPNQKCVNVFRCCCEEICSSDGQEDENPKQCWTSFLLLFRQEISVGELNDFLHVLGVMTDHGGHSKRLQRRWSFQIFVPKKSFLSSSFPIPRNDVNTEAIRWILLGNINLHFDRLLMDKSSFFERKFSIGANQKLMLVQLTQPNRNYSELLLSQRVIGCFELSSRNQSLIIKHRWTTCKFGKFQFESKVSTKFWNCVR